MLVKSLRDLSHFCLSVQQSYKKHHAKFWENYWALALHIYARLPLHSQQPWLEWSFSSQKCLTSKMNKLLLIPCLAYGMLSLLLHLPALSWIRSWENFPSRDEVAPSHPGMPQQRFRSQCCWEEVVTFHCLAQGAVFKPQPSPRQVLYSEICSQVDFFLKVYYLEGARQCFFNVSSPRSTAVPISYTKTKI